MRLLSMLALVALVLLNYNFSQAQDRGLFSPFDCREHAETVEDDTQLDIASFIPDIFVQEDITIDDPLLMVDTVNGWKDWMFVENFAFGKDRGDLPMITDMAALHPFFRDRILSLVETCKRKGIELAVVETYRTHAKQDEYKIMGKRYTSSGAGKSKHQYGLAIDVVPMVNGKAIWDNSALWRKVGTAGEKLGLRWGGRWKKPYDPGHFEWTGGLATANLHQGTFPTVPLRDEHYPCLDEDIKLLRKYWSEWETSQSSLTRK
ncbi:MAG TPA: M15 family metallopeptidase [Chryseolinea sp.]|nr:M15 family metallopeptidase [Chryseolinea sp.]